MFLRSSLKIHNHMQRNRIEKGDNYILLNLEEMRMTYWPLDMQFETRITINPKNENGKVKMIKLQWQSIHWISGEGSYAASSDKIQNCDVNGRSY